MAFYIVEPGAAIPTAMTGTVAGQALIAEQARIDPAREYGIQLALGTFGLGSALAIPGLAAAAAPAAAAAAAPAAAAITTAAAPITAAVAPAVSAAPGASGLTKLLLAGGAGFVAASLMGGGQDQELKQTAAQDLELKQALDLAQAQEQRMRDMQAAADLRAQQQADVDIAPVITAEPGIDATYDIEAGGAVEIGGSTIQNFIYNITRTVTGLTQIPTIAQTGQMSFQEALQIAQAAQVPTITQTQEAKQMGGMDWLMVAALAVGAFLLLKRKK